MNLLWLEEQHTGQELMVHWPHWQADRGTAEMEDQYNDNTSDGGTV